MIERVMENKIIKHINDNKAIIIIGPRQVGKSTLIKKIITKHYSSDDIKCDDGQNPIVIDIFKNYNLEKLILYLKNKKVYFIDEAQNINDIGSILKLIIDHIPHIKIFASGSSAFELKDKLSEALTGRKWEYNLFPISFKEMVNHTSLYDELAIIEHRLVYGYYPEVINNNENEIETLNLLKNDYLYKDILKLDNIKYPSVLDTLVKALAYQVGSEVNLTELSQICRIDIKTITRYLDVLEKAFIIFRLNAYSTNKRNELKKAFKVYFYDNGILNAIIADFRPFSVRENKGALWENFIISERLKNNKYSTYYGTTHFWRSTDASQKEIDYIEIYDSQVFAYEIKYNKTSKIPLSFKNKYPNANYKTINKNNFYYWLLDIDNIEDKTSNL